MKFLYKAIRDNKIVKGKIDADSESGAAQYLRSQNLLVIEVKRKSSEISIGSYSPFSRVSFSDIVNLTRQLSIMLNSGLTVIESLDILKKQTEKRALVNVISQIDQDVRGGLSFSAALKQNKHYHFSNLYISLVKAGEASGKLDEILLKLADNLENQRAIRGKLKGALIYPALVIAAMIGVMFVMITFVLPQLLNLYKDFEIELPVTTQILISVSTFFQQYWMIVIVSVVFIFIVFRRFLATKQGKLIYDKFLLKVPLINKMITTSSLVDSTRTLSILIGAGVSILEALDIIIETSVNSVFQKAFKDIYKKVERGETLGRSLDDAGIFPPILVQMATVGEETGHLDDTLMRISNFFEMESNLAIKALTTMIEPAILVVLGVSVGGLIMAVITPIYNLTSAF